MISWLRKFLTAPVPAESNFRVRFWLFASLTVALVYSLMALQEAFSGEYIVQDDARQHIFWMRRFLDPQVLPNDLIADYYQSVAPWGYAAFYQLFATLGIDPLIVSKVLPLFLCLVLTAYCFGVGWQILPVPITGFIASLLLNQNLWSRDDLVSGTARAFFYPLMLAFLYYLLRRSLLPCLGVIVLQGLFYPLCVLLSAGVLVVQLVNFKGGRLQLSSCRRDYIFCASGLALSLIVLLPQLLATSEFGPIMSIEMAKTLPEFLPEGRTAFFVDDPWYYWLKGRSGLFSYGLLIPLTLYAALLLPLLLVMGPRLPLTKELRGVGILGQLILTSLGLFVVAHAVLFQLYLPNRYTGHSLRIILALAAAIAFTLLIDGCLSWAEQSYQAKYWLRAMVGTSLALAIGYTLTLPPNAWRDTPVGVNLLKNPHFDYLSGKPWLGYTEGGEDDLYEFFAQTPKNTLIASLSPEADNLPTFAQRSVLVSKEYALPYHVGYYRSFRQRMVDLITAQYSTNPSEIKDFIDKYEIDFWLLERDALTLNHIKDNNWLKQYQPTLEAIAMLEQGISPAFSNVIEPCIVFESHRFWVLEAGCVSGLIQ